MINKKSSKEMANNKTKLVAGLVVTFQRESLNSSISQEYWIKECKKENNDTFQSPRLGFKCLPGFTRYPENWKKRGI